MRAFLRGLLFSVIGAAVGFAIGAGLSFLFEGSLHVVAGVVVGLVVAIAAFSWGLAGFNTVTKGLLLLTAGGIATLEKAQEAARDAGLMARAWGELANWRHPAGSR